ncbi:MAG: hypothetical protein ACTSRK_00910 [Promethearchaeota archaeon]
MIFETDVSDLELMHSSAMIVIILYFLIVIQILVLNVSLFKKWKQRRKIAVRNLAWSFVSYFFSFVCLLIAVMEGYITGYKQILYRIFMGLGFFFLLIGHVIFLTFAKKIYGFNQKYMWIYEIMGILVAIFAVLPQNYYGVPTGQEGPNNIRMYSSMAMLAYSLYIFTRISIKTFQAYKRITLPYARYGFLGFFIAQIAMIFVFLFNLGDFVYWFVFNLTGYTIFFYLAVVCGMISIMGFYLGIVVPPYLQKQRFTQVTLSSLEDSTLESMPSENIGISQEKERKLLDIKSDVPSITIQCPECKKFLFYEVPINFIEARMINPKDLVSIAIPVDLICEHGFVIYIDKQFQVRSTSSIDHEHVSSQE